MKQKAVYRSPLGKIWLQAEQGQLTAVWFEGQKYAPEDAAEPARAQGRKARAAAQMMPAEQKDTEQAVLAQAQEWLARYFAGKQPLPEELPLAPEGTPFQQMIWQLLRTIPYGQTVTYGEIAGRAAGQLGRSRMSAQAVGNAVGHNPLAIVIPCHRVVGAGGKLTGYAAGIQTKAWLLAHERM